MLAEMVGVMKINARFGPFRDTRVDKSCHKRTRPFRSVVLDDDFLVLILDCTADPALLSLRLDRSTKHDEKI